MVVGIATAVTVRVPAVVLIIDNSPGVDIPAVVTIVNSGAPDARTLITPVLQRTVTEITMRAVINDETDPAELDRSTSMIVPTMVTISRLEVFPVGAVTPAVET